MIPGRLGSSGWRRLVRWKLRFGTLCKISERPVALWRFIVAISHLASWLGVRRPFIGRAFMALRFIIWLLADHLPERLRLADSLSSADSKRLMFLKDMVLLSKRSTWRLRFMAHLSQSVGVNPVALSMLMRVTVWGRMLCMRLATVAGLFLRLSRIRWPMVLRPRSVSPRKATDSILLGSLTMPKKWMASIRSSSLSDVLACWRLVSRRL